MRKLILNSIFILFAVCIWSLQAFAASHTITIKNNFTYSPSSLSINFGDDVVFVSEGTGGGHPTVAENGTDWVDFELLTAGEQKTITGLTLGTHGYYCQNHGFPGGGMSGTITVNAVSGTKSSKVSMYGLTIAPNPFDHEVNLNLDQNHNDLSEIKVTDIIGNEVAVVDLKSKVTSYKLDLSYLKPGIYFFNLYSDKGIIETRKLIRTH